MKMGVWLFSMPMEERRQRPFALTILQWRKVRYSENVKVDHHPSHVYINFPLVQFIFSTIKHQIVYDLVEIILRQLDLDRPVRLFSAVIYHCLGMFFNLSAPETELQFSFGNVALSTCTCILFLVYVQMQLQLTYDIFNILFTLMYKSLPILEKWQLGNKTIDTRDVAKTKAALKRIRGIRAVKVYLEQTISMPPAFNRPWCAYSLRDFWARRWHTYYNECFYRLGYQPIRLVMIPILGRKPPRWLPALSVFVMSGLMHEYFLYAATGPALYFQGTPIPACFIQFSFFVSQAVFISIGDRLSLSDGFLGRAYAVLIMILTCHLFVVPYLLTGYLYMPRASFYRTFVNIYQGEII
ncbi:uncharacterized protein RHIMIDRAFT_232922 [Rhizopus microsporus ATCC 52813]|uniref:Wax synthase domain-containing protein n=2 Tax=Rhizopus microsporus TaxID=58291 RepID=A0A2G4T903_RHIZD|nr:uncharacterized protein RHIMIDRAFT_232922 [Rhizopus microsporus ATCC 52813]PHZ17494.1 hypothetical protein RHIMIDRAFT_232922 [Rhizopus microsporus ATCC 52813]